MSIREKIMQIAQSDPRFAQAIDAMERAVTNMSVTPEDLDEGIKVLEDIIKNPNDYAEIRARAISEDMADEALLPEQYDQIYIVSLLVALYGLQDRLSQKGYARGGLTVAGRQLAAMGRNGDTELAHINRQEAEMLRRAGGSGTINPHTGLPEYFNLKKMKWGKIAAAVIPAATMFFFPYLAPAIGGAITGGLLSSSGAVAGAIGATATNALAGALGAGVIGGTASALTGQDPLRGALTGAVSGGLGSLVGSGLNAGLNLGLSQGVANVLGGGLTGAGIAAATGRNPLTGGLMGAAGSGIGELGGLVADPNSALGLGVDNPAINRAIASGTRAFGNTLTAGGTPTQALISGGLGGLASGLIAPSSAQLDTRSPSYAGAEANPGNTMGSSLPGVPVATTNPIANEMATYGEGIGPATPPSPINPTEAPTAERNSIRLGPLLAGGAALAALSGMGSSKAPPAVQRAVGSLPASQQEYFNRPGVTWDWNKLSTDAASSNLSLDQYIARNWNRVAGGEYNTPVAMAQGGLNAMSRFVKGGGTGRSDEISAKLSDGEYVIDAETVAMLGDGSSKAGAKRLDEMRESIRKHKGKVLAKGKFSPNAKSPLTYLKGVA
jgi:hypothetical protein